MPAPEIHPLRPRRSREQSRTDKSSSPNRAGGGAHRHALNRLPFEIQLMIISELDVSSLLRLRQTCRLHLHYVTPDVVRKLFVPAAATAADGVLSSQVPDPDLRGACRQCLGYPGLGKILVETALDDPWQSTCLRCWRIHLRTRDRGGRDRESRDALVVFASGQQGSVCRVCGWPCLGDRPSHRRCRFKAQVAVAVWFALGFVQFSLTIVVAAAAWSNYDHIPVVMIPASVAFGLAIISVLLVWVQTVMASPRFLWNLVVELVSTALWVPPVYFTAVQTTNREEISLESFPIFACAVFASAFVIRLLNTAGYLLLYFDYDARNPYLPDLPASKKALYVSGTLLVLWAFPVKS
ncbi:hypothetical protein F4778DRAFT_111325 [Xylariomycetidae sp. FL2044]|nr:hypothetical protein F4778DRAFT_111325 [Xylariomycetidae sp. FL2044]